MHRLIAAGIGGIVLSALLVSGTGAADKKDGVPTTEEIMKKVNKPKGLHKAVGKALEEDKVEWDNVTKMTKEYAELAGALGLNPKPDKGSKASWDKLCKSYGEDAKALEAAVNKKDKTASGTAWSKLNKSCQGCHDEHR